MSAVRHGGRGPNPAHVDDTLLRVLQLRDAMVGHAQLARGFRTADGMTAPRVVPIAVINI